MNQSHTTSQHLLISYLMRKPPTSSNRPIRWFYHIPQKPMHLERCVGIRDVMGASSSVKFSGQYLDLETCKEISGAHFDESKMMCFDIVFIFADLFNIFAIKVVPRHIFEQLIRRPTIDELKACKIELEESIRLNHCGPMLVRKCIPICFLTLLR